jgi:heptosyltransferase-1
VAVSGALQDRSLAEMILERMRYPALNLAGRTDLGTLIALMAGAAVVISTDSGPMHLAAALGTPVVALFGPTAPWRTGPYGKGHKVLRAAVSCSPCFLRRCHTRRCMRQIGPEQVLEAVREVLEEKAQAG